MQREALKELENLKLINNELNSKIERQYKKMEVKTKKRKNKFFKCFNKTRSFELIKKKKRINIGRESSNLKIIIKN